MKKGFTLVEIVISLVVFSLVLTAVVTIFTHSQSTKYKVDKLTEAQQAARTAIDYIIKDLRSAGYSIDLDETGGVSPQRKIVYAGPFEIVFNANLQPQNDPPENPSTPQAINPAVTPLPVHYIPSMQYRTGAETIVYTLDYNNDGQINSTDKNQTGPSLTANPNDYALIKRVYGYNPTTKKNGGENLIVSIVGGPDEEIPLFTYWYDNDGDPSTPPVIWGDTDGDGEISASEYSSLTPITNIPTLDKIVGVRVNVTGVSSSSDRGKYLYSNMITDVAVTRNASIDVFTVLGHVYYDTDKDGQYDSGEPGLDSFYVRLNTGELAITDNDGYYAFALIPGTYGISCSSPLGYRATTDLSFDFTVSDDNIDFTSDNAYKDYFGFITTPTAYLQGFAFIDNNGDGLWQSSEEWVPNVSVNVWNNSTKTLDGDPADSSYGTYLLEINAEESVYVWVSPPDSYYANGIDTVIQGLVQSDSGAIVLGIYDNMSMGVYHQEGAVRYAAFSLLRAEGEKPYIRVISPNGGEVFRIGEQNTISVAASGVDDNIEKLMFYYSVDAGGTWRHIGDANYPIMIDDTLYNYTWIPDDTLIGSTICYVKVGVIDEGGWTVYDQSDNYFTLVSDVGFRYLYFTYDDIDSMLDETMFLYALGSSKASMPKYLNTINSYVMGIGADSFNLNGTFYGRPFYRQDGKYLEFVTIQGMPYADTIYPGRWYFFLWGYKDDGDEDENPKHFDVEVYKRDSIGDTLSQVLLFSTLNPSTYDTLLLQSPIGIDENEDTIIVSINHGFDLNLSDRLYIKVFYSGSFSNTGGQSEEIDGHIQFHFGGTKPSRIILPPKQ